MFGAVVKSLLRTMKRTLEQLGHGLETWLPVKPLSSAFPVMQQMTLTSMDPGTSPG